MRFPRSFGFFFIVASLCFLAVARKSSGEQYISQTYIDTTIQRAYYNINAATDVPGMGPKMEDAIAYAKKVIARLKSIAKDNPNEKYIVWKVGELESQVYLEESGLLVEKQNKKQKIVNDLVNDFNTELGKRRPNFVQLTKTFGQVSTIDASTASDMGVSLSSRKKGIAKEAMSSCEISLEDGNFDRARQELFYLKENLEPLGIQLSQYSVLSAKVQAKITVDSDREFIVESSRKIEEFLSKNDFPDAHGALAVFKDRIEGLRGQITTREWDKYFFKSKKLFETLDRKEDSLVKVNLFVLGTQGITEANDYLEATVKKLGVTQEKIGRIDLAILERAMANKKLRDTAVVKQLAAIPQPALDDTSTLFSDMVSAAKKKAKLKSDSISALKDRGQLTQAEEVRQRNMRLLAEGQKSRVEQMQNDNREKANKEMIEIYTMIEKKNYAAAKEKYLDRQAFLARYIPSPAFTSLDSTVNARCGKKNR